MGKVMTRLEMEQRQHRAAMGRQAGETWAEIGKVLGVSYERARQLAWWYARRYFNEHFGCRRWRFETLTGRREWTRGTFPKAFSWDLSGDPKSEVRDERDRQKKSEAEAAS